MTVGMNFAWAIYAKRVSHDVLFSVSIKYTLLFTVFALLSIHFRKEYKKIFNLIALIAVEYLILNILDNKYLGLTCTIVQLISESSQWESIIQTYKTKNAQFINTKQQAISGISSLLWTIIGFKASDPFMLYPNCYNFLLHTIQFILGIVYNKNTKAKAEKQN